MKLATLALALAVASFAQGTKPSLTQLKPPAVTSPTTPTIVGFVTDASGNTRFLNIRVDSTLALTITGADAVLTVRAGGAAPAKATERFIATAAGQAFTLSAPCSVAWHVELTKNGIVQDEADDFILSGTALQFTPVQGIAAGDKVIVRCYR